MKKRTIAASLAAVAVVGGVATAANASTNGQGNLYANQYNYCGGAQDTTQPGEGFIVVHRTDATHVSVNYQLKNAQPGVTNYVYLLSGYCNFDAYLGTVTANSNGVANANFKDVPVPAGDTSVWTYSYNTSTFSSVQSEAVSTS